MAHNNKWLNKKSYDKNSRFFIDNEFVNIAQSKKYFKGHSPNVDNHNSMVEKTFNAPSGSIEDSAAASGNQEFT